MSRLRGVAAFNAADAMTDSSHFAFFYAPWCQVCQVKAPLVDELAREFGLPLHSFDIESADGAREYERRSLKQIPTLALIRGEHTPFRLIGAMITRENVAHLMRNVVGGDTTPSDDTTPGDDTLPASSS
jgi:thiol-disulfide isomerase/thioredoxin